MSFPARFLQHKLNEAVATSGTRVLDIKRDWRQQADAEATGPLVGLAGPLDVLGDLVDDEQEARTW